MFAYTIPYLIAGFVIKINYRAKLRTLGDFAEARRNHCAVIRGKFLFIIGGVNSYGKYL